MIKIFWNHGRRIMLTLHKATSLLLWIVFIVFGEILWITIPFIDRWLKKCVQSAHDNWFSFSIIYFLLVIFSLRDLLHSLVLFSWAYNDIQSINCVNVFLLSCTFSFPCQKLRTICKKTCIFSFCCKFFSRQMSCM